MQAVLDAPFSFLGGVPRSILYDNTKLAVARILSELAQPALRMPRDEPRSIAVVRANHPWDGQTKSA